MEIDEAAKPAMTGRDMEAKEQPCKGCGKPLLIENAWMEDGCPCNTPAGVNNLNLYRWRLLHELQQQQSRKLEAAEQRAEKVEADAKRYQYAVNEGLLDGFIEGYCADNDIDEAEYCDTPEYKTLADAAIDAARQGDEV